jgi:hypothetical protein
MHSYRGFNGQAMQEACNVWFRMLNPQQDEAVDCLKE